MTAATVSRRRGAACVAWRHPQALPGAGAWLVHARCSLSLNEQLPTSFIAAYLCAVVDNPCRRLCLPPLTHPSPPPPQSPAGCDHCCDSDPEDRMVTSHDGAYWFYKASILSC